MHEKLSLRDVAIETAELRLARAHERLRDGGLNCQEEELSELHREIEQANSARREAHAMEAVFLCRACKRHRPVGEHVLIVFDHVVRRDPVTREYRNYFENSVGRRSYLQICEDCDRSLQLIDYSGEKGD